MDVFGIIVNFTQTSIYCWELYSFVKDARKVDENIESIAAEVQALGDVCDLAGTELKRIVDDFDDAFQGVDDQVAASPYDRFWNCIDSQLAGCRRTIGRLTNIIKPLKKARKNFMHGLYHQLRLRLSEDDIVSMRRQMHSHSTTLSIALEAVNMKVQYLSMHRLDDRFHGRLQSLESNILTAIEAWTGAMRLSLPTQAQEFPQCTAAPDDPPIPDQSPNDVHASAFNIQNSISELRSIADSYKNGGHIFTEEDEDRVYLLSFAEGVVSESGRTFEAHAQAPDTKLESVAGELPNGSRGIDIAGWIAVQTFNTQGELDSVRAPPTIPPSAYSVFGHHDQVAKMPLDALEEASDDSEEDENVEMSRWALNAARQGYELKKWAEAYENFREALQLQQKWPLKYRQRCESWEPKYKIAICAFRSQSPGVAETALLNFAEEEATDDEQRLDQCHVRLLLSQLYACQGKLELAQSTCRNTRRAIQKLQGRETQEAYIALALESVLYRLHTPESSGMKARMCADQIPEHLRNTFITNHERIISELSERKTGASSEPLISVRPEVTQVVASNEDDRDDVVLGPARQAEISPSGDALSASLEEDEGEPLPSTPEANEPVPRGNFTFTPSQPKIAGKGSLTDDSSNTATEQSTSAESELTKYARLMGSRSCWVDEVDKRQLELEDMRANLEGRRFVRPRAQLAQEIPRRKRRREIEKMQRKQQMHQELWEAEQTEQLEAYMQHVKLHEQLSEEQIMQERENERMRADQEERCARLRAQLTYMPLVN